MFVQIKDLTFNYKNSRKPLFENLSLGFKQGEVTVILGQSGSGKSTLLRLIAGLEIPARGSISIDRAVMNDSLRFVQPEKRGVGLVFQDYALFPHMTVEKNIKFGLHKMSRKQKQNRMEELLTLVGMEEFASRYPYELSGGQQQRVALARALAPNPSLIMFDEPFSNLDSKLQEQIRDDLKDIIKLTGITSIFVTHDEEDARAIGDRIVLMHDGKIQEAGRPEAVFKKNREKLSLAYV
ncbi:ABC transporter [Fictibacillus phosphorivorans]|uniref:Carnitine transport ATP-binding protein OpuCA n=1 Tax=Fictibacillus phosphorivorans TaxID=1221500 RepID=A0A165N5F6_9BACL|nr:ABC transporter ATP-binding protein [Fictibacillus phosphorivorans]KZE64674.1 ABC transporter [Fictibacillus phosphorivorans]